MLCLVSQLLIILAGLDHPAHTVFDRLSARRLRLWYAMHKPALRLIFVLYYISPDDPMGGP